MSADAVTVAGPVAALASPAPLATEKDRRRSHLFIHGMFITSLCLQRFGLTIGTSVLFISLPVFVAALSWAWSIGLARIRTRALVAYGAFALCALISVEYATFEPDPRVAISVPSMAAVLVTYAMWIVGPSAAFDGTRTLEIFVRYVRAAAVLGIVQYLIQYAGIQVFSFAKLLPSLRPALVESQFEMNPVLNYGSPILRSNGFFLLEPSIFSQLLVIAASVDGWLRRRYRWLPVYVCAYVVSFSGTGLLGLAMALPIYSLTSRRALRQSLTGLAIAIVAAALVAVAAPSVFGAYARRAVEIQSSGSSAYARYVAQFASAGPFINEWRSFIGYGPGATERAVSFVKGSASPALKLVVDYGYLGLASFAVLAGIALVRSRNALVAILALVLYQFGGGYFLVSPFIVMITMLCVWSAPGAESPGAEVPPADARSLARTP